jgi:hypothetical protein
MDCEPRLDAHQVLLDDMSKAFMAPVADFCRVIARAQEQVEEAFRRGGGVSYAAYDLPASYADRVSK